MSLILNPSKRFAESAKLTNMTKEQTHPKSIRDVFAISEVYKNGIFKLEGKATPCLYDRCYVFSDINYTNKDINQKKSILENLMFFLNSMNCDFKITVANEYKNMNEFISKIMTEKHKDEFEIISTGIHQWIDGCKEKANINDLEKVLCLTVSTRAYSYDEARSYFLDLDGLLEKMFGALTSKITPLNAEERLNIIRQFFYKDTDDIGYDFNNPYKDAVSYVIPYSVETYKDYMVFNGNKYVSVLLCRKTDSSLDEEQAIRQLSKTSYQSFCTIDYAPVDRSVLKDKIADASISNERAISQEIDARSNKNQLMAGISYQKDKKKDELEAYSDQIDDNNESCLLVGIMVVISADTEDDLARRIDEMKVKGRGVGIFLETYNFVQIKAFNTALPIGCRLVNHMISFLSSSLVSLQPFYAQDLMEPGGFLYGLNDTTKNLVFANRKSLKNPHGILVGHTGGGKSFAIKLTEVSQTLLFTDDDIIIIDPQNEFMDICALYNGSFLDFTPKGTLHINPMEIPVELFNDKSPMRNRNINSFVSEVEGWVFSFFNAIMISIDLTSEHRSFLGDCVRNVYDKAFASKVLKQPTIVDLRSELANLEKTKDNKKDREEIHRLYNTLQEYTEGAYDIFAYPSNIDINNRLVVFGLKNVDESFWESVMITIMFFLSSRMKFNRKIKKATRFIIDETQVVTENELSASMLLKCVETYRKFGGIVTMAMQNFSRVLNNPNLRDMYSNCEFKCFLDQGGMDANNIALVQDLSATEFDKLTEHESGKMVMVWGGKVILLDSIIPEKNVFYDLYSTNPHDKEGASNESEPGTKK